VKLRELIPGSGFGLVKLTDEHGSMVVVDTVAEADGVFYLCPVCFAKNGGPRGTHAIISWRPRVPQTISPTPGRWEFEGTTLDDITLVAGSSSILLQTAPCKAHFFIRNGEIVMCQ
jgi:hypothetical protein